jgi:hypothetical protein
MSKKSQKMPAGEPPSPASLDEVKVLFPEEQVGPYTIRPWTLTQFGQAVGVFYQIIPALTAVGVTFDNLEKFLVESWPALLPAVLPSFPQLIGLTLRLEPDDLKQMDAGTKAALGLRIILQNKDQIKNFLTLALGNLPGTGASSTLLHSR